MNTKTARAPWLHTTIVSALIITGIYCLPTQASARESWSIGGNSFSLILAQNQGGFFKRLAAKNRAKQAQRQTYNAQRQQSNQPAQQSSNLNQWNPFHNPSRQSNQPTQQSQPSNSNNWNPFQNQQNQNTQNTNTAASSGLTNSERTRLVNFHNQVRAEVGVGQLRWSGQIAAHAQQWADEIARTGNFRHRSNNPYGENLAQGTAGYYTVVKLAEMWYNEKRLYTPGRPFSNSDMRAGHYTQMVWRGSTQMGAGKAIITSGRNKGNVVLVCNYAQRGNMIGQRPF